MEYPWENKWEKLGKNIKSPRSFLTLDEIHLSMRIYIII